MEPFRILTPWSDWRMAGRGHFLMLPFDDVVQSEGGPGILWYPHHAWADFEAELDWRATAPADNSGFFFRIPPLGAADPDSDWQPAVTQGLEVQIDNRGIDAASGSRDQPLFRTGAIYGLAPAALLAVEPAGEWNTFVITARGDIVSVMLNGVPVSRLDRPSGRRRAGHVGLQAHHDGSRVQFRPLRIREL